MKRMRAFKQAFVPVGLNEISYIIYHFFHTGDDVRTKGGVNGVASEESRQYCAFHHGAWTTGYRHAHMHFIFCFTPMDLEMCDILN